MRYNGEERPTCPALLHTSPPILRILILQVGLRWSPSTSLLLHLYLVVLNEGLSSSFYTPPKAVAGGVIHENMGNRLEEGAGDLPAKVGPERR
jgi:hypothetical protein